MGFFGIKKDLFKTMIKSASNFVDKVREKNGQADIEYDGKKIEINSDEDIDDFVENKENLDENKLEISIPVPDEVEDLSIEEDDYLIDEQSAERTAEFVSNMQGSDITEEPTDRELNNIYSSNEYSKQEDFDLEPLPEDYEQSYFPDIANRKPDVEKIKKWVEGKKFKNKTKQELAIEYARVKGLDDVPVELTDSQKKALIDSVSYMVARKIWYVGRKPSSMSDHDWNELTKFNRPPEGSFSDSDKYINIDFPYDSDYVYKSGDY